MSEETTTAAQPRQETRVRRLQRPRAAGKKARFTEIGVAFPHKDGKGFDILLDAMPLSGRITLRVPEPKQ